ncbi:uncharacterized protein LOC114478262 isoform X2 [Gouania willdenowi]|uniref:uncharacterized protein LOC114478262 isoform X2 n=1 Tax=Gouania willdenowi TaxID=441366 RepID=UPI001056BDF4|nr:uncharacterized protein LOC114478262 isoform X2 [Gouania willdenowi]
MSCCSLLGLVSFILATAGHYSTDALLMVALRGETVVLSCGLPPAESCSSINWNMEGGFGSIVELVKNGGVTAGNRFRHELLEDCSLKITHLEVSDARIYCCVSDLFNSSVSLQLLKVTEWSDSVEGKVELHCFLDKYTGYTACKPNTGIHIQWVAEDDSPLQGDRFIVSNPSECFSKLTITSKPTDHHRKWKCRLSQNDKLTATVTYMTSLKDGIEEVFAAVGDPVTLSCGTSSHGVGGSVDWVACKKSLSNTSSSVCGQTNTFHQNNDTQLVITEVRNEHAGNYTCSQTVGQKKMLNNIRLHTLDIIVESGPAEGNTTLTCVLTCATECDKDFTLTWSEKNQQNEQNPLIMTVGDTIVKPLQLPVGLLVSEEVTCSVHSEGVLVASKKWHSVSLLQNAAWLARPLCIVMCVAAGGLFTFMYMKKRYKRNSGNEESRMAMTHVYEMTQDVTHEEQQQQNTCRREAVARTDSFHDLLQAVY